MNILHQDFKKSIKQQFSYRSGLGGSLIGLQSYQDHKAIDSQNVQHVEPDLQNLKKFLWLPFKVDFSGQKGDMNFGRRTPRILPFGKHLPFFVFIYFKIMEFFLLFKQSTKND